MSFSATFYFLIIMAIYCLNAVYFLRNIFLRRRIVTGLPDLLVCILSVILLNHLIGDHPDIYSFSQTAFEALLILQILYTFLRSLYMYRSARYNVHPTAIKEAVDSLPSGLCYYYPDGYIKLANVKMEELSEELCHCRLSDGRRFFREIVAGKEEKIYEVKGRYYMFRRNILEEEKEMIFEIVASDVSEEYLLALKLEEERKKERELNDRLRALSRQIKLTAMDKEALNVKISIHDRLGACLLLSRRYLKEEDSVEKEELLQNWKLVSPLLYNDRREDWDLPYYSAIDTARALGVEVLMRGEFPEEEEYEKLMEDLIQVASTNVSRHASGKYLYLSGKKDEDHYYIKVANDGEAPKGEIQERGGLKNLRREIASLSGTMEIDTKERFVMKITLERRK